MVVVVVVVGRYRRCGVGGGGRETGGERRRVSMESMGRTLQQTISMIGIVKCLAIRSSEADRKRRCSRP